MFVRLLACVLALYEGTLSAQVLMEVDLPANDIAFNAQTGLLYASIASSAGLPHGNHLIEISPNNASIVRSVFVGSEPGPIGMSPDAAVAYVGLNGAARVMPVDLTSLTTRTDFTMGNSQYEGPRYAGEIAVVPGAPNSVAIVLSNACCVPSSEGVGIFDNGVERPDANMDFSGPTTIAFGSSASTLYGYDGEDTSYNFSRMTIDASGISNIDNAGGIFEGFYLRIVSDGDTVFSSSGAVVDGTQLELLGTYTTPSYGTPGAIVVDKISSIVILAKNNTLYVFDRDTFIPVNYVTVTNATGNPIAAATCGTACVAVVYDSSQIFVVPDVVDIFSNGFE